MKTSSGIAALRPLRSLSLALLLASTAPLAAQYGQPLPQAYGRSDADSLADQVRALAANPNDLNALIRAGELALKLEDPTAAGGFFARAERIDPRNARVKAGTGVLLVQSERPGEALRRFAEAESYGGQVSGFAADRGLAFDLIGEQERAQRDYRLALKTSPDDETTRRYALSLGISGKREEALALLDPLLRKSDRGAWRARAFILAMSGDRADAEQIATTMMPAGMSQGLQPFFDRLPTLSPVDRAFAVHFGEIRASTQRLADARMVPVLPPLGPDPDARELAAAAKAREKPVRKEEVAKPVKRKRNKHEPVELAVQAVAPPTPLPLPAPPSYVDPNAPRPSATPGQSAYYVQPLPTPRSSYTPSYSYTPPTPANRAAATTVPFTPTPAPASVPTPVPQPQTAPVYQPVQRTGGRVMPLAPLQPEPLPAGMATASRAPTRTTTPPVETATKVERVPQPTTPYVPPRTTMTMAAPPPETATRVERTPPAPYVAPTPRVEPAAQGSATPYAPPRATVTPAAPPPAYVAPTPRVEQTAQGNATPVAVARPVATTPYVPQPTTAAAAPANPVATSAPMAAAGTARPPSEDAILSGIIARIGVPGSELGVAPVAPAPAVRAPEPVAPAPVEAAAAKVPAKTEAPHHKIAPVDDEPVKPVPVAKKSAAGKTVDTEADGKKTVDTHRTGKKTTDADPDADTRKGADTKRSAGKKAAESDDDTDTKKGVTKKSAGKKAAEADDDADIGTKKGADSKKAADKKADAKKKAADAKKKDPKLLEPSRVWVQVSGGANENDLPKQWNKLRTDKPGAFKGRQGWTTPLRATNRILTGPFASEAEAQSYVNKLSKQGLSGFVFTSDAGQKIDKLPAK